MKIAVCYSGQYRKFEGWQKNHEHITKYAHTVLYTTWKGQPVDFRNCTFFDEPKINYNPFTVPEFIEKFPEQYRAHRNHDKKYHLTKQIIGHQLAVDSLKEDYDVIIKMRYDLTLGDHNWLEFIEKSYQENMVIGFGGWTNKLDSDRNNLYKFIYPDEKNSGGKTKDSLCDFMIIHPKYKMANTLKLNEDQKLFAANKGWYQVLIEPYAEPHLNIAGGVMLTRYMVK